MIEQRAKSTEHGVKETPPPHPPFSKGGRRRGDEKGIALVMVLVLSAIALAIMAGLIYMITSGTQISGIQKRYKTALEAGVGGTDIMYQLIKLRGDAPDTNSFLTEIAALTPTIVTPNACSGTSLQGVTFTGWPAKLNTPTSTWVNCDSSLTINPPTSGDNTTYDFRIDLAQYRFYGKIVDTVEGNTGPDEDLKKSDFPPADPAQVMKIPYLYTIEVDAQDSANPAERAKLSILYQY